MSWRRRGGDELGYDNTAREAGARANRRRILRAASESFLTCGYAGTTVRSVAAAAGLSPESLYKIYGGKAGLLKAVYDVSIAGDDAAVPIAEREHAQAVRAATTPAEAAAAWAQLVVAVGTRAGPLLAVLLAARDREPAIGELFDTIDGERMTGARLVVQHWQRRGWIRLGVDLDDAAVTLWALNSAEVRSLLARRGWSDERYVGWLAGLLRASVLVEEGVEQRREQVGGASARSELVEEC